MPTQVPSVSDFANLLARLDTMNTRIEELELLVSRKCEHQEVVALIDYAMTRGVQLG